MDEVDSADLRTTWTRLLGQRALTLGNLDRRKGLDLQVVLGLAATCLEAGQVRNEIEVSRLLDAWLEGTGSFLRCDRAELRRWLVDLQFWQREDGGRRYTRAHRSLGPVGESFEALAREAPELAERAERAARSRRPPRP